MKRSWDIVKVGLYWSDRLRNKAEKPRVLVSPRTHSKGRGLLTNKGQNEREGTNSPKHIFCLFTYDLTRKKFIVFNEASCYPLALSSVRFEICNFSKVLTSALWARKQLRSKSLWLELGSLNCFFWLIWRSECGFGCSEPKWTLRGSRFVGEVRNVAADGRAGRWPRQSQATPS